MANLIELEKAYRKISRLPAKKLHFNLIIFDTNKNKLDQNDDGQPIYQYGCGTIGCIAGWISYKELKTEMIPTHHAMIIAAEKLELTYIQSLLLFTNNNNYTAFGIPQTQEHKTALLKHFRNVINLIKEDKI